MLNLFKNSQEFAEHLLYLLETASYKARFAGGCVRDMLLGAEPKDYDIATTALPEQTTSTVESAGFVVLPTGLQHGTVTAVGNDLKGFPLTVEITTLRIDRDCYGRHAEVEFTDSFGADAARRDFTINAMYMDRKGTIYDYVRGQEDLKNRTLRFVGDPHERIKEDYLRIMRYFRFATRFNMEYSDIALRAIENHKEGLRQISQERITSELMKILEYPRSYHTTYAMWDTGVFDIILPEYNSSYRAFEIDTKGEQYIDHKFDPICRLASLINGVNPAQAEEVGKRLKLTSKQIQQLKFLCTPLSFGSEPADSLDMFDQIDKYFSNQRDCLEFWDHFDKNKSKLKQLNEHILSHGALRTRDTPVSAEDIMSKHNIKPGKMLGDLLKILKRAYRNKRWQYREEALLYADICNSVDKQRLAAHLTSPNEVERQIARLRLEYLGE